MTRVLFGTASTRIARGEHERESNASASCLMWYELLYPHIARSFYPHHRNSLSTPVNRHRTIIESPKRRCKDVCPRKRWSLFVSPASTHSATAPIWHAFDHQADSNRITSCHSFSLTTFSPSGKLVQIEHALAAVSGGQTSLGIKGTSSPPNHNPLPT